MTTPIKKVKQGCWLVLAWLVFVLTAQAATPTVVTPVAKENRNRVNIILLGDALPDAVAIQLQRLMVDEFNFYQLAAGGPEVGMTDAVFNAKRWGGALLSVNSAGGSVKANTEKMRLAVKELQARNLAVTWTNLAPAGRNSVLLGWNDAARAVMREANVSLADVRGALLPSLNEGRDTAGQLTEVGVEIAARTIATAVRKSILDRSSPWAELPVSEKRDPAHLLDDAQSLAHPVALPLAKGKTTMVYRAEQGGYQFNLHSFLAHYEGKFWAVWSSGHVDEDGPSQLVRYATSPDGYSWSESKILVDDPDGPEGKQRWMANGIYVDGGKLYALATRNEGVRDGMIWADARLVRFEWSGTEWRQQKVVAEDSLVYFPPIKVNGRDFAVWRNSRAHFATALSEPGADRWKVTPIPGPFPAYRLSETSHYVDADGIVHLIIRDQGYTGYLYHAVSYDGGDTWSIPVKTNFPDAASKNFADRLSNGWFYLINNPRQDRPRERDPLTITFSREGWTFGHPLALRKDSPPLRYPGKYKGSYSFQYSHAIEHEGKLWVIYATNKEDIEVTSFDIGEFGLGK